MSKPIRFNAFEMNCVAHQSPGLWRHPRDRSWQYKDVAYWTDLARILERGIFDAVFIAEAREDIPALLAEVDQLRARLTVDEDMVERAARAMCDIEAQADQAMWDKLDEDERDVWRIDARAALDAALGTGEES